MTLMRMPVTLLPAQPEDDVFQQAVYASTRADEMALVDWSTQQKQAFVQMQFMAQKQYYRANYPRAEWHLIHYGGQPVGRMIVDRSGPEILLIDIALIPEHRRAGIGSALIQDLIDEARRVSKPICLHVETFNPARNLYQRLGFTQVSESGIYIEMKWGQDAARGKRASDE